MIYRAGEGVKLRLKRTAFGKELTQEIPTDLAVGIRVIGIERDKITNPRMEGVEPQKFHSITFSNTIRQAPAGVQPTGVPALDAFLQLVNQGQGQSQRRGFRRMAVNRLMVFENDLTADGKSALTLFDGIEPGDFVNASVTRMGGSGFKVYAIEKTNPPEAAQVVA